MTYVRCVQILTVFVALASLVLGVVDVTWDKPVSGYQMVMILLPVLIGSVVVLHRWTNIPIDRMKRNLPDDKVKPLLVASVSPRNYPPCVRLCVAHANAVSVAGLSARNVFLRVSQLIMMMNREQSELNPREKIFSLHVVETHLSILRDIHSILGTLSSDGSLVADCYHLLQGGSQVMKVIEEAGTMMDLTIIRPMDQFLQGIPAGADRYAQLDKYKDQIREIIKVQIPGKLGEVVGKLLDIQHAAREIHEEMQVDWHNDTQACWGDYLCKPIRTEEIRVKKRKIDSVERTVANWIEKNYAKAPRQVGNN